MANEIRVRANFVAGQLSSAMLTGDTTIQGAGLADLPAIGATEYAPIAIFRTDNAGRVTQKEIVWVTAHTAGATTATATRGREGTTAQAWNVGDRFSHTDTALDNLIVCTSATRPATPFEGLEIYERDTKRKRVWDGAAWLLTGPKFPAARLRRVAAHAVTGAWVALPWDAVDEDNWNSYSGGAPTRLTCQEPGVYNIEGTLSVGNVAGGSRGVGIRKNLTGNSGPNLGTNLSMPNTTWTQKCQVSANGVRLALNDWIELCIITTVAANTVAEDGDPHLAWTYVGA